MYKMVSAPVYHSGTAYVVYDPLVKTYVCFTVDEVMVQYCQMGQGGLDC
jgi:hypothetical protein